MPAKVELDTDNIHLLREILRWSIGKFSISHGSDVSFSTVVLASSTDTVGPQCTRTIDAVFGSKYSTIGNPTAKSSCEMKNRRDKGAIAWKFMFHRGQFLS